MNDHPREEDDRAICHARDFWLRLKEIMFLECEPFLLGLWKIFRCDSGTRKTDSVGKILNYTAQIRKGTGESNTRMAGRAPYLFDYRN